jgi:starch phosphorylase
MTTSGLTTAIHNPSTGLLTRAESSAKSANIKKLQKQQTSASVSAWNENRSDILTIRVPEFYSRNQAGIPAAWVARIRESMARLTPRYSAERTVREYTTSHYIPAAEAYRRRAENGAAAGIQIVNWRRALARSWGALHFGELKYMSDGENYMFEVDVSLDGLEPAAVQVELYADAVADQPAVRQRMRSLGPSAQGSYRYSASAPANRPWTDYTPRVVPHHDDASVPLEAPYNLWQR